MLLCAVHSVRCIDSVTKSNVDASHRKTEAMNLRMSPAVKGLLRAAASREHRTLSNMLEVLILEHCRRHGIAPEEEGALETRRTDRPLSK